MSGRHTPASLGGVVEGPSVSLAWVAGAGILALATLPASWLRRLIGLTLIGVVLIDWRGLYPRKVSGRHWGVSAGVFAGLLAGAVGAPGPPVVLDAAAQGWSPRAMKATLWGFFSPTRCSRWWGSGGLGS